MLRNTLLTGMVLGLTVTGGCAGDAVTDPPVGARAQIEAQDDAQIRFFFDLLSAESTSVQGETQRTVKQG